MEVIVQVGEKKEPSELTGVEGLVLALKPGIEPQPSLYCLKQPSPEQMLLLLESSDVREDDIKLLRGG
jgi:hypothetical protein